MRAEEIAGEFGVTLSAVEGAPDVWESDNLTSVDACHELAERLDALGCGSAATSGLSTWVTLDLSEAMAEWRAESFGTQTGSAHL